MWHRSARSARYASLGGDIASRSRGPAVRIGATVDTDVEQRIGIGDTELARAAVEIGQARHTLVRRGHLANRRRSRTVRVYQAAHAGVQGHVSIHQTLWRRHQPAVHIGQACRAAVAGRGLTDALVHRTLRAGRTLDACVLGRIEVGQALGKWCHASGGVGAGAGYTLIDAGVAGRGGRRARAVGIRQTLHASVHRRVGVDLALCVRSRAAKAHKARHTLVGGGITRRVARHPCAVRVGETPHALVQRWVGVDLALRSGTVAAKRRGAGHTLIRRAITSRRLRGAVDVGHALRAVISALAEALQWIAAIAVEQAFDARGAVLADAACTVASGIRSTLTRLVYAGVRGEGVAGRGAGTAVAEVVRDVDAHRHVLAAA